MAKVFRYFSCTCGAKFNAFVQRDMSDMEPTYKAGHYKQKAGAISKPEVTDCKMCGQPVECSSDPNGLPNKFYFNFMES